jgi:integrase
VSEVGNGALRQFVEILTAARLAPKTIVNVVTVVKFIVASAVDEEGDQIHPRVWNYEFIQLPLVVKEKQNRPTITEAEISAMVTTLKGRDAVLVALVAGTGLRIGEALAIRTDDFDPLCRLLQVRRSVWRRREQAPKTLNAIRPVDIPESLAQVLCRYIKGRGKGHLFTTRAGRLLDSRNVLDVLQQAGRRRIPRVPPLSFCGAPQGGGTGRPHQTVAGPFTKLDGPLRRAITVRRGLSSRMV